jgi:hypothetical protein
MEYSISGLMTKFKIRICHTTSFSFIATISRLNSAGIVKLPTFWPIIIVAVCFVMNVLTVAFVCVKLGVIADVPFGKVYNLIYATVALLIVTAYYSPKYRRKRLLKNYAKMNIRASIMVVLVSYILSVLLLMIAAMYKNGNGVFS